MRTCANCAYCNDPAGQKNQCWCDKEGFDGIEGFDSPEDCHCTGWKARKHREVYLLKRHANNLQQIIKNTCDQGWPSTLRAQEYLRLSLEREMERAEEAQQ